MESIFTTKHLEKMPLEDVTVFPIPIEWEMDSLSPEDNEKFIGCMTKLKEKVVNQVVVVLFFVFFF